MAADAAGAVLPAVELAFRLYPAEVVTLPWVVCAAPLIPATCAPSAAGAGCTVAGALGSAPATIATVLTVALTGISAPGAAGVLMLLCPAAVSSCVCPTAPDDAPATLRPGTGACACPESADCNGAPVTLGATPEDSAAAVAPFVTSAESTNSTAGSSAISS